MRILVIFSIVSKFKVDKKKILVLKIKMVGLNCSIKKHKDELRRKYIEAIHLCKQLKLAHNINMTFYSRWLMEFKTRINDINEARSDGDDDILWIQALRERLRVLDIRMMAAKETKLQLGREYRTHQIQKRRFQKARMALNDETPFDLSLSRYESKFCNFKLLEFNMNSMIIFSR